MQLSIRGLATLFVVFQLMLGISCGNSESITSEDQKTIDETEAKSDDPSPGQSDDLEPVVVPANTEIPVPVVPPVPGPVSVVDVPVPLPVPVFPPLIGGGGGGGGRRERCGNGEVGRTEQCDEGSANSDAPNASCRTNCTDRSCGDGIIDPDFNETCDDGNTVSNDGCSATCTTESTALCGNGTVEIGEFCDDAGAGACTADCLAPLFDGDFGNPVSPVTALSDVGVQSSFLLNLGFSFSLQGDGTHTQAHMNSNGNITFGAADALGTPSLATFLSGPPRIGALWADLIAPPPGQLFFKTVTSGTTQRAVFTWFVLPESSVPGNTLTFQLQLINNGNVLLSYNGAQPTTPSIVGITPGNNAVQPAESDLSSGAIVSNSPTIYEQFLATGGAENFDLNHRAIYLVPQTTGWSTTVSTPPISCGDGILQPGETCDASGQSATCDDDCTLPTCGDGNLNETALEACDDANTVNGDGCSSTCTIEPSLTLTKTSSLATNYVVGQPITYTVTVTNSGTVTVFDLDINETFNGAGASNELGLACVDALAAPVSLPAATLAAGAVLTCTATYTPVLGDTGPLTNTAQAQGGSVDGGSDVLSNTGTVTLSPTLVGALTLTKTSNPLTNYVVGQPVAYTVTVTNSGTAPVFDVDIVETFNGAGASNELGLACVDALAAPVTLPVATLAVGAVITCTANYTPVVGDTGPLTNTAQAQGGSVDGGSDLVSNVGTVTLQPTSAGALTVTKTASPPLFYTIGQATTYTVIVTNSGGSTIFDVDITETFNGVNAAGELGLTCVDALAAPVTLPAPTLAAGATLTCTASYTPVLGEPLSLNNTAIAQGGSVDGGSDIVSTPASVNLTPAPVR